jgi:hypothetical protein
MAATPVIADGSFLHSIDWSRPWYGSLKRLAQLLTRGPDWRCALNDQSRAQGLCNHRGLPIRFVEQSSLPQGIAYESFISDTGCIPTRENLHDYFNALVWLRFPRIKQHLNAMQARCIDAAGISGTRGTLRDFATLFDENAALLAVNDTDIGHELIRALKNHHWQTLFMDRRAAFMEHVEVWLFGHALLEKLSRPFKAITAHGWLINVRDDYLSLSPGARHDYLDMAVARQLAQHSAAVLSPTSFMPLPVLGIPGWASGQDAQFYQDTQVFRPKRRK